MAVLHACIEMDAVVGEMFVEVTDEYVAFLCLQASAGMVLDDVAFDAHEVAAHGEVAGLQLHADAGSLQRSAAFVHEVLVVAENTAVRHF